MSLKSARRMPRLLIGRMLRVVRQLGTQIILGAWNMPGWSVLFDATLSRRLPYIDRSVSKWVPTLKTARRDAGAFKLVLSGTGMLIALQEKRCLYLPLSAVANDALVLSKSNHSAASQHEGPLRDLFEYRFDVFEGEAGRYGQTDRLFPISLSNQARVRSEVFAILNSGRPRGELSRRRQDEILERFVAETPDHSHGWAAEILARSWSLGWIHGDLTPNNVMVSADGAPRLIDLDRVWNDMPLVFDILHFSIERCAKHDRVAWTDVLGDPARMRRVLDEAGEDLARLEPVENLAHLDRLYIVLRVIFDAREAAPRTDRWRRLVRERLAAMSDSI